MKARPRKIPGIIPAIKSAAMLVPVMTPKMIIKMLGGMSCETLLALMIRAVANVCP